ncbi:MAG: thioredoxin domain-containing protein [Candidatus Nomurabacteria bacterium]
MNNIKNFFKDKTAVAIIIAAFIIGLSILGYAFINKSKNNDNLLNDLVNADKIFSGRDFKDNEYILGNTKNKITIMVYSDFECPFCKMLQENTIQKLQKEYSLNSKDLSQGKIGIVYRHFAQSYHTKAPLEINASLCTRELYGQASYENFINRIYSVTPANNGLDTSTLPDIANFAVTEAKENGEAVKKDFDKSELQACLTKETYNQEFLDDAQDAIDAGLDGTPYTVILFNDGNKNMIINKISGVKETSYFENIINKLLKIK